MNNQILKTLSRQLDAIETSMDIQVENKKIIFRTIHPSQVLSAQNLIHYLTLRSLEIRSMQHTLHELGLSSLASSESHIKCQIQAIQQRVGKKYTEPQLSICTYNWSKNDLKTKSVALFGHKKNDILPYVMVTFDVYFAIYYTQIKNLLLNGMNVARINCAHDDETVWSQMILKLKKASAKTGIPCKIYMDLAGPKIRTIILNKGAKKGCVKVEEEEWIWFAESKVGFNKKDIVLHPNKPRIIDALKIGDRVFIDDGIIEAEVQKIKHGKAWLRITRISSDKKHIKEAKGINFPDSDINIPSLTEYDIAVLPFVCKHADMIGYSFIRDHNDLTFLAEKIKENEGKKPNVIIKIETPDAVINLPKLLIEGMKSKNFGVMIARGDLAVEIGFERMSETQEEILWICEAAHTPVIWATQVLESMNKSGVATRSEITDAVKAGHAECVLINKGTHTIVVMETLQDIMQRTSEHRSKKRFIFRPLKIAQKFISEGNREII